MRPKDQIELKIKLCETEIARLDEEYHRMHQIDMQSSEGATNRELRYINIGQVKALNWVLSQG
jgi:hypothetical protein